jgi:FkbM family methyltransferase
MAKTLKRHLIESLDHRGARWLLAALATRRARRLTGKDVELFYDAIWMHRIGENYLSDLPKFSHYDATVVGLEARDLLYQQEAADYWFYRYCPRRGDVIVDIGAGIGTDEIAFSKAVGPEGAVLAIEAHPVTFLALTKTCKWNRLDNVRCIHGACMDKEDTVYIEDELGHESNAITTQGIPVRGMTLDCLLDELGISNEISFLKINIEGAERWALPGMEKTLSRTRNIAVACHDFRAQRGDGAAFATLEFVSGFLRDRGFDLEVRSDDPRPYVRDHVHGMKPRK